MSSDKKDDSTRVPGIPILKAQFSKFDVVYFHLSILVQKEIKLLEKLSFLLSQIKYVQRGWEKIFHASWSEVR